MQPLCTRGAHKGCSGPGRECSSPGKTSASSTCIHAISKDKKSRAMLPRAAGHKNIRVCPQKPPWLRALQKHPALPRIQLQQGGMEGNEKGNWGFNSSGGNEKGELRLLVCFRCSQSRAASPEGVKTHKNSLCTAVFICLFPQITALCSKCHLEELEPPALLQLGIFG